MRKLLHLLYAELAVPVLNVVTLVPYHIYFKRTVNRNRTAPLMNSTVVHCSLSCTRILEVSYPQNLADNSASCSGSPVLRSRPRNSLF